MLIHRLLRAARHILLTGGPDHSAALAEALILLSIDDARLGDGLAHGLLRAHDDLEDG